MTATRRNMREIRRLLLTTLALGALHGLLALPATAQASPHGFTVRHEAVIGAPSAEVYRSLVEGIGEWWNPSHTFSGDSKNLSIDARLGGCFCETFPDGGGVEHLRVVYLDPGKLLRLSGALGPLQAGGVTGSLTWKLTDGGDSTTVEVTYVVGGFMEVGLDRIAPAVRGVIGEQLSRLKLFVETGKPTAAAEQP